MIYIVTDLKIKLHYDCTMYLENLYADDITTILIMKNDK